MGLFNLNQQLKNISNIVNTTKLITTYLFMNFLLECRLMDMQRSDRQGLA